GAFSTGGRRVLVDWRGGTDGTHGRGSSRALRSAGGTGRRRRALRSCPLAVCWCGGIAWLAYWYSRERCARYRDARNASRRAPRGSTPHGAGLPCRAGEVGGTRPRAGIVVVLFWTGDRRSDSSQHEGSGRFVEPDVAR